MENAMHTSNTEDFLLIFYVGWLNKLVAVSFWHFLYMKIFWWSWWMKDGIFPLSWSLKCINEILCEKIFKIFDHTRKKHKRNQTNNKGNMKWVEKELIKVGVFGREINHLKLQEFWTVIWQLQLRAYCIYKIVVVNLNCSSLPVIDCCFNNFTRYMTLAASVFTTIVSEKFSSTSLLHTKYFPDFQGLIYGLSFTSTNDFSFIFLNYPLVWLHDILWSQGHGHVSLFHDGGRKFFGFK